MRRSLLAALAGAALLAAGCAQGTEGGGFGGDEESPSAGAFGPDAEMTGSLTIMGFGLTDEIGQVRHDRAVEAVDGAEVQVTEGELDMQQFLSSVASGSVPGLINADRTQIGTLASRGAIIPLTSCIEGEGIDTSQFVEAALAQVTFDGEVYGIPEFNTVTLTMANSELLEQAGLGIEDVDGSDWEAVARANEALHKSEGNAIEVIGYDSKLPEFLPLWVHANGGQLISDDGRTAMLDDPTVLEALEWAVGIYDAQGGFGEVKAYRDSADFFGEGNQFASGTLGAMPMEQWYLNVLNEVSPDAPLVFDAVHDREGNPIAYASGAAWAIPKGSEAPAAACRFVKTMTETDSWLAAAQARAEARAKEGLVFTGLLTGNRVADEQIREELVTESGSEVWDGAIEAMYTANENSFTLPASPADAEFKQAWMDAVNRVLNGQQGPEEALAQAQEEAQGALDDAWASWDERNGD